MKDFEPIIEAKLIKKHSIEDKKRLIEKLEKINTNLELKLVTKPDRITSYSNIFTATKLKNGNFVIGSLDGSIRVYDSTNLECLKALVGHKGSIYDIITLPENKIASISHRGIEKEPTIRIWDLNIGKCTLKKEISMGYYTPHLVYLKDNLLAFNQTKDTYLEIIIFNFDTGEILNKINLVDYIPKLKQLYVNKQSNFSIRGLSITENNNLVCSVVEERTNVYIVIFDIQNLQHIKTEISNKDKAEPFHLTLNNRLKVLSEVYLDENEEYYTRIEIWDKDQQECLSHRIFRGAKRYLFGAKENIIAFVTSYGNIYYWDYKSNIFESWYKGVSNIKSTLKLSNTKILVHEGQQLLYIEDLQKQKRIAEHQIENTTSFSYIRRMANGDIISLVNNHPKVWSITTGLKFKSLGYQYDEMIDVMANTKKKFHSISVLPDGNILVLLPRKILNYDPNDDKLLTYDAPLKIPSYDVKIFFDKIIAIKMVDEYRKDKNGNDVYLFDLKTGKKITIINSVFNNLDNLFAISENAFIYKSTQKDIRIIEVKNGLINIKKKFTLEEYLWTILDNKIIVAKSAWSKNTGDIEVISMKSGKRIKLMRKKDSANPYRLAPLSENEILILYEKSVKKFNIKSNTIKTIAESQFNIDTFFILPNNRLALTKGYNVFIFDLKSDKLITTIKHNGKIRGLTLLSEETLVVGSNYEISFWNLESYQKLKSEIIRFNLNALNYLPDNRLLVSDQSLLYILKPTTLEIIATYGAGYWPEQYQNFSEFIMSIKFTHDFYQIKQYHEFKVLHLKLDNLLDEIKNSNDNEFKQIINSIKNLATWFLYSYSSDFNESSVLLPIFLEDTIYNLTNKSKLNSLYKHLPHDNIANLIYWISIFSLIINDSSSITSNLLQLQTKLMDYISKNSNLFEIIKKEIKSLMN